MELNDNEKALILALRNRFRYGDVIIVMRDGIPQRIKQAWVFKELRNIGLDKKNKI